MCGISGFVGFEDKQLLRSMAKVQHHRGPDETSYYTSKECSLAQNRLAIIDLKKGIYPVHNEDETIFAVYNGETYNYKELNCKLQTMNHQLYTNCDAETIIHAYEQYEEKFLQKLNGMYAFALWDSGKKQLILARDPCGIKPLHYRIDKNKIFFSSEIKALLTDDEFKRKINKQALHYFINLRYIPGELTIFENIKQLPAGHYLIFKNGKASVKKFSKLDTKEKQATENYWIKQIKQTMQNAVKRHLISDVPLGVYLSGGVDSSSITAFASKASEKPVKTFCMGFGRADDEFKDAQVVADYFGTDHKELTVKTTLLQDLPEMIWHMDTPKRNTYPYYIAEVISKHVKVALSGLGGDELFCGYEFKYQKAEEIEHIRKLKNNIKQLMKKEAEKIIKLQTVNGKLTDDIILDEAKKRRDIDSNAKEYLLFNSLDRAQDNDYLNKNIYEKQIGAKELQPVETAFAPQFKNRLDFKNQIQLADFQVKMPNDFLIVGDRMSSAFSIEDRVPFLDKELVDLAFTIPISIKYQNGKGKYIFKKAMKQVLPQNCFTKPKQGFASNTFQTYQTELKDYAEQFLENGEIVRNKFIKEGYIKNILNEKTAPLMTRHYDCIWNLLTFEIWYRMYMMNENIEKPKFDLYRYAD